MWPQATGTLQGTSGGGGGEGLSDAPRWALHFGTVSKMCLPGACLLNGAYVQAACIKQCSAASSIWRRHLTRRLGRFPCWRLLMRQDGCAAAVDSRTFPHAAWEREHCFISD